MQSWNCIWPYKVPVIFNCTIVSLLVSAYLWQFKSSFFICFIHLFELRLIELSFAFVHSIEHWKIEILLTLMSFCVEPYLILQLVSQIIHLFQLHLLIQGSLFVGLLIFSFCYIRKNLVELFHFILTNLFFIDLIVQIVSDNQGVSRDVFLKDCQVLIKI